MFQCHSKKQEKKKKEKKFNWRIIALQCCAGFCQQQCESAASIHYVPSLLNRPSIPPHLTFLGCHTAPG